VLPLRKVTPMTNTNTLEELIEQRNAMCHRREALRAQVARLDAAIEAVDRWVAPRWRPDWGGLAGPRPLDRGGRAGAAHLKRRCRE